MCNPRDIGIKNRAVIRSGLDREFMYQNSGTALNEDPLHFLIGGGDMAETLRAVDWSATELGEVAHWPLSLRYSISFCLSSSLPTVMFVGENCRAFFNDAFRKAQGASRFDFGRPAGLFWGLRWPGVQKSILEVRSTGHGGKIDLPPIQTCEQKSLHAYFECTLSPMYGDSQQVENVLATLVDNTIAVVNARRMMTLREADRHKNEFLATLAHELRNPLAPIRSGMQVLQNAQNQDPLVASSCKMMDRQVTQLVRLVDDLMDVGRISQGKLRLHKEVFLLAAAISDAVETSRPMIEERGHELTVSLPEETLLVEADCARLAQVFTNLLNNASKYTNRGGRIWLNVAANAHEAEVRVRDNGIGIALERAPDLFKLFVQLGDPNSQSPGGLGIGLSLVRQIVELHAGTIEAYSEGLGHGSEFVVRLPLQKHESACPNLNQGSSTKDEPVEKMSLRILIVDDNKDGADSQAMMLRLMGNETWIAYDGLEGIQMAEQFRPDVILLDIGLPTVSGYEVCRCIREQGWGDDVVLIAVTGWGLSDDRVRAEDAGFDHHLVKPVDSRALARLLASISKQLSLSK